MPFGRGRPHYHYGLLASPASKANIARARALIAAPMPEVEPPAPHDTADPDAATGHRPPCPCFSIRPWMCKTFLTGHHLASQTVSPTGPCFSPGSALWPSQYGIRRMKRNNLRRVLLYR
jgi:hypothetical protein